MRESLHMVLPRRKADKPRLLIKLIQMKMKEAKVAIGWLITNEINYL